MKKILIGIAILLVVVGASIVYFWPGLFPVLGYGDRIADLENRVAWVTTGVEKINSLEEEVRRVAQDATETNALIGSLTDETANAVNIARTEREAIRARIDEMSKTVRATDNRIVVEQRRRIQSENEMLLAQASQLGMAQVKQLIAQSPNNATAMRSAGITVTGEISDALLPLGQPGVDRILHALLNNGRLDIEPLITKAYATAVAAKQAEAEALAKAASDQARAVGAQVAEVARENQAQTEAIVVITEPTGAFGHSVPRNNKEAARAVIAAYIAGGGEQ